MCAFYYTVGNFGPKYRSQLKNIYLALLVHYKLIQQYSYAKVIQPLSSYRNLLQSQGITVKINDNEVELLGGLVTISSDNLSAQCSWEDLLEISTMDISVASTWHNNLRLLRNTVTMSSYHVPKSFATIMHQRLKPTQQSRRTHGCVRKCPFSQWDYCNVTQSFPPYIITTIRRNYTTTVGSCDSISP